MRILFIIILSIILPASGITQESNPEEEGFDAYTRGDFQTAHQLWLPLAEKGDKIAQYNIGILNLHGQGVEQNVLIAKKWFNLSAKQQYDFAMLQMGMMDMQESKFREALKWFDKIVLYVGNEHSETQKKAEELIKELYKKVEFFPPPAADWTVHEVYIQRIRKEAAMLAIFYRTTIAVQYSSTTSGQKIQIYIDLNDFNTGISIDAFHGAEGPEMEEIRELGRKNGIEPYRFGEYEGYTSFNKNTGIAEKTIKLWETEEMGQNIIISVMSTMNNKWVSEYFEQLNFKGIAEVLEGHAYTKMSLF